MKIYHILLFGVVVNILTFLFIIIIEGKDIYKLCDEKAKEKGTSPVLDRNILNLSIIILCMIPYFALFSEIYEKFFKGESK